MAKNRAFPLYIRHRIFQFDAIVGFTEGILYTLMGELQISVIADVVGLQAVLVLFLGEYCWIILKLTSTLLAFLSKREIAEMKESIKNMFS